MTDHAALIEELEAATAGSRNMSDRILIAHGWTVADNSSSSVYAWVWRNPDGIGVLSSALPDPSRDLSDTIALVQKGNFAIENFMIWPGEPVSLTILGTHNYGGERAHKAEDGRWKGEAATPALAVSAASLKAISA